MAVSTKKKPPVISLKTRIGWIGSGVMGLSMCNHVLTKGHKVLDSGATWAESSRAVAEQSDAIFTMVGFPEDVREVYLGESGILTTAKPDSIVIDMTTTSPSLAQEIHSAAASKSVHAVDAPVSGGDVGARNGTLSIMVGGNKDVIEAIEPLLETMGKQIVHQGGPGAGQHAKMCNQIVIAGTMIGVCESLLYGYKSGLDLETMLRSVSSGAAACWILDNIALPGLALVHQLYQAVKAQGHGKLGTQALMLALEQLSNTEVKT